MTHPPIGVVSGLSTFWARISTTARQSGPSAQVTYPSALLSRPLWSCPLAAAENGSTAASAVRYWVAGDLQAFTQFSLVPHLESPTISMASAIAPGCSQIVQY